MFEVLIIGGVAILSFALRTFHHPVLRKAGTLGVLSTTFLIGYFLSGRNWIVGSLLVSMWFFLPWVELLARVRPMRMPLNPKFVHRFPPNREEFPFLSELSDEFLEEGYEKVDDLGWDWEEFRFFTRVFYHPESRTRATICLNEQSGAAFSYFTVSNQTSSGLTCMSWNYPFPNIMKFSSDMKMNRVENVESVADLLEKHERFLRLQTVDQSDIVAPDIDHFDRILEREQRKVVTHNLDTGLLQVSGEGTFRYSWRGLFFIWFQFLRDFVRLR